MKNISDEQKQKTLELSEQLADEFDEKKAEQFSAKNRDKSWYDDFKLMLDMMLDKEYIISTKTKVVIAGTLAYVILPLDIIPDILPIIGWLDDGFVLSYNIQNLSEEIEEYKKFKQQSVEV